MHSRKNLSQVRPPCSKDLNVCCASHTTARGPVMHHLTVGSVEPRTALAVGPRGRWDRASPSMTGQGRQQGVGEMLWQNH